MKRKHRAVITRQKSPGERLYDKGQEIMAQEFGHFGVPRYWHQWPELSVQAQRCYERLAAHYELYPTH